MPRKSNPTTEVVDAPLNTKALAKANAALTEMGKRSAEVAERFGDGLPYDRERIVSEAKFLMAQSAEAMLEAGKRLIQIKENEPFGDFIQIVESRLGLAKRTAQVMMAAAVKYLSPALTSKAQTFALLGKSKLFDLMVESDGDLAELAEGGTVAGLTLDDMHSMSVRELRDALAEARQTLEARSKLLDKANAKADRLQEQLDRPYKPSADSEAKTAEEHAMLETLKAAVVELQGAMLQFGNLVKDFDDRGIGAELRQVVNNDAEYIAQTFALILQDAGIPVQFQELADPSWAKKAGKKAKGA